MLGHYWTFALPRNACSAKLAFWIETLIMFRMGCHRLLDDAGSWSMPKDLGWKGYAGCVQQGQLVMKNIVAQHGIREREKLDINFSLSISVVMLGLCIALWPSSLQERLQHCSLISSLCSTPHGATDNVEQLWLLCKLVYVAEYLESSATSPCNTLA